MKVVPRPVFGLMLGSILAVSGVASASAANLCVNPHDGGCFNRISEAVSAASAGDVVYVSNDVFPENVVITKPLSLVGDRSIIDAAGLLRGIFIDGLDAPALSEVHISGFTVKNASLEGILVLNASNVTLSNNFVVNNNQALVGSNGTCPLLPAFEPGEGQDCGEGIHLQGADHTIVTGNYVQSNAGGGILLSDDTGATHHNLISFNTVSDNAVACGISLASHVPAAVAGSAAPFGVFQNTVYGNRSQRNGRSGAGGAGIGIFASVPGAKSYGNVIAANLVSENGHPGISMHAHAPNQNLNDNVIVGNTVVGNGADTNDAHTAGPTGINLYSFFPATGNVISGNAIQGEAIDVGVNNPGSVQVNFNMLSGLKVGLENIGSGSVDASNNFWSCEGGPLWVGSCSSVVGPNVNWGPWLKGPFQIQLNY